MGRWAVRFLGTPTPDAVAALRERGIEKSGLDHLFEARVAEPSTTVVVQASSKDGATARVRSALEGHGEFSGLEATRFVDPT
jgi:hypothetical protein